MFLSLQIKIIGIYFYISLYPFSCKRILISNFRVLHNVTGFDVRVRKLEPHIEKNLIDTTS